MSLLLAVLASAVGPPAAAGDGAGTPSLYLVRLEPGPRWDASRALVAQDGAEAARVWAQERIREGVLRLAGRACGDPLLIVQAPHVEAALRVVESNPLVASGVLRHRVDPLQIYFVGDLPVLEAPETQKTR